MSMFRFKVIAKKNPTESFRKIATALNAIVEGEVLEKKWARKLIST